MSLSESLWNEAVSAYRAGQLPRAEQLAQRLAASEPRPIRALHLLSLIAYSKGNTDLELEFLDRLLALQPDHVEALNGVANILKDRGQWEEGLALCQRAIQARPGYANAYNTLGLCYQGLGRHREAAEAFEKALSLQPDLAAACLNMGASLQQLRRPNEAVECYRKAVTIAPNSAEAYEALGQLYLDEGKREEAMESFRRAVDLRPNSLRMLLQLAELLARQQMTEEAGELAERALALDPTSARAHNLAGFRMIDLGRFEGAAQSFVRSISLRPEQADAYLGLVTSRRISESDRPAIESINALIDKGDVPAMELSQLHAALSKAYDDLGEFELAVHHMDEANRVAIEDQPNACSYDKEPTDQIIRESALIFTHTFFEDRKDSSSDSEVPLFIVGMPRSGTTLLEQILSCHPQIAAGGEIRYWGELQYQLGHGIMGLAGQPERAREFAEKYLEKLRAIDPGVQFISDKMPSNYMHLGILHMVLPNARILHCRRNPLDNCVSLYMTPFRPRLPFTWRREDVVACYQQYQKFMELWRRVLPADRFLEVDYEDLVGATAPAVRRVLEFCGLDWDEACLSPEKNARAVSTPSNWQARQKVYSTSVERWKGYEPWLGALKEVSPGE